MRSNSALTPAAVAEYDLKTKKRGCIWYVCSLWKTKINKALRLGEKEAVNRQQEISNKSHSRQTGTDASETGGADSLQCNTPHLPTSRCDRRAGRGMRLRFVLKPQFITAAKRLECVCVCVAVWRSARSRGHSWTQMSSKKNTKQLRTLWVFFVVCISLTRTHPSARRRKRATGDRPAFTQPEPQVAK